MTLQVQFEPEARDERPDWHDNEWPGLGDDLLAGVEATVEHIVR